MKKYIITIVISLVTIITSNAQIDVIPNGNVGIGGVKSPDYRLVVAGSTRLAGVTRWDNWTDVILDWTNPWGAPVLYPEGDLGMDIGKTNNRIGTVNSYQYFTTIGYHWSDKRLKKNINSLNHSLSQIKKLQGVTYNLINDSTKNQPIKNGHKDKDAKHYGLIAQDVQKVYPELVKQDDSTSMLAVNYTGLIPIIIEAIKEQSESNDSLKAIVTSLTTQLTDFQNCCKTKGGKLKSDEVITSEASISNPILTSGLKLYQNAPNPFKESTTIKLEIPQTVASAMVCIYDLNGRQLKCLTVSGRGTTSVQIFGNELTAGMYHYALIADGALVDSKTMILTE